jgi:hypothetical protein
MIGFKDVLNILPIPKERLAEPSSTLTDARPAASAWLRRALLSRGGDRGFVFFDATGDRFSAGDLGNDSLASQPVSTVGQDIIAGMALASYAAVPQKK